MNTSTMTPTMTIKPIKTQTKLTKKQFSDRVLDLLNRADWRELTNLGTLPAGLVMEELEETNNRASGVRYTFYDDDQRKWVITKTVAHDGFQEVLAKSMYPYTDGSYADFDGEAVGTRKAWFEVGVDGRWKNVGFF